MIKNTLIFFILTILHFQAYAQSPTPAPYCTSKPVYSILPLTIGEIFKYDMSNSFTGYNLDISIKGGDLDYASIPMKLQLTDRNDADL